MWKPLSAKALFPGRITSTTPHISVKTSLEIEPGNNFDEKVIAPRGATSTKALKAVGLQEDNNYLWSPTSDPHVWAVFLKLLGHCLCDLLLRHPD